jgi:hypothetical protein
MTLLDLRQAIESRIPVWVVFPYIAMLLFICWRIQRRTR